MTLTINDLKRKSVTPKSIIEERLSISQDPSISLISINNLYQQLQDLLTAITYKKDKIISPDMPAEIFEPLFSKVAKLDIKKIDSEILLLNNSFNEKKLLLRMLKLGKEIDLHNYATLENIINGNDSDEWNFLALFFRYVEREDEYCKKFKDKMIDGFQKALENNNKYEMRKFFDVLYNIDDWRQPLNLYIYSLNVLNVQISFIEPEKIDIDFYSANDSEFFKYVDNIKLLYNTEFLDLDKIFTNQREVLQMITSRIFNDFVSLRLETFLKTHDPILFLMNLNEAYIKIKNLDIDANENLMEIFDPYLTVAIQNEKQAIELILGVLSGKKSSNRYIILGSTLEREGDIRKVFLKALNYFNAFVERCETLNYEEDDIESVVKFFIKKLEVLIAKHGHTFEDIHKLSEIYTILKVYFMTHTLPCFDILSDFFQSELSGIFSELVSLCKKKIKREIKKITISQFSGSVTSISQKIIQILSSEFRKLPLGRNGNVYISNVLSYTIEKIENQILQIKFNKEQAFVLVNDIESYLKFLKDRSLFGFIKTFEILKENVLLIFVDANDLQIYIKTVGKRMERSDIKKWLKCRNDYQNVKKYLKL
ncbi:hypothetical protein DMUE_0004 [Dictyocoela muelleri]|nr:hypothetical protein DMUE_0004 [Dictyocoela muelleri]